MADQLRTRLPLLPQGAEIVSEDLAVFRDDDVFVFFNASGPIYTCKQTDEFGVRVAAAMFSDLGLATVKGLGKALGVHRSTVHRHRQHLLEEGTQSLKPKRRGPRGPSKLKDEVQARAQKLLDEGVSIRSTAKAVGVTEGAIRSALKKGALTKLVATQKQRATPPSAVEERREEIAPGPSERSNEDAACDGGVAVKRVVDRALACAGKLPEALPEFHTAEGVAHAGVLLALPGLLQQGLLQTGESVYGRLSNGFFGLRATLLTFAFMALLRIKTTEQLASRAPGEFGRLLGLDRAPEVKTLRRKLAELGERGLASVFRGELARYWVTMEPEAIGFLYIDGHVRPYNGRKHKLPKAWVTNRRMCLPATNDIWVNDVKADPVFFITAQVNQGILETISNHVLPQVRSLVGEERRVTLLFDREGWSPKKFCDWNKKHFDVISYRKAPYAAWPDECFFEVKGRVDGTLVRYKLGERSILLSSGFWMREIRKLCDDGHQVSIVTTRQDLDWIEIVYRMASRWQQENFFRYMKHEFALDHLCTYAVEPGDPARLMPNPEWKRKDKELRELRTKLAKLQQAYGKESLKGEKPSRSASQVELSEEIRALQNNRDALRAEMKKTPKRVAAKTLLADHQIVRLEEERKTLTDAIKMIAYRAETSLAQMLSPFLLRHEDDRRNFIKTVLQLPGDLIHEEPGSRLVVRLHGMANPRSTRALAALCELVNAQAPCYPGTNLRMAFETVRDVATTPARGQEP